MRQKLLPYLFFLGLITLFFNESTAQCIPNNDPVSGIEPDTLSVAYVGVPYEQIIYFKLPHDTTVQFGPVTIALIVDSLIITSYNGLPPSFSLACNTASCTVLGGENGCAAITGTATASEVGIHPLKVYVITYVSDTFGTPVGGFPDSIDFYFMNVQLPSGVEQVATDKLVVGEIYPNPSDDKIGVPVTSPVDDVVELTVMDISGKEMEQSEVAVKKGNNTEWVDISRLPKGFYFMRLSYEGVSVNRKFLVRR